MQPNAPAAPPATITRTNPLRAFGPEGQLIGLSYDGAKSWVQTPDGARANAKRTAPVKIEYRAKVCAVNLAETPSFDRRVKAPFSAFRLATVLAGWADLAFLGALPVGEIDIVTLPGTGVPIEILKDIKQRVRGIVLDLDEPTPGFVPDPDLLAETVALVDVITVPTKLMADEARKRHPVVYVVPPVIDSTLWADLTRPGKKSGDIVRIGVTNPTQNPELELAIEQVMERYSAQIDLVRYNWWELSAKDGRKFYPTLDIAVLGSLGRYNSAYPAHVAAAGGAAIIAGRGFGHTVRHGHNGLVAGVDNDHKVWRRAICDLLLDTRQRQVLGRNARNEVRRYLANQHVGEVTLPYKLLATGRIAPGRTSEVRSEDLPVQESDGIVAI